LNDFKDNAISVVVITVRMQMVHLQLQVSSVVLRHISSSAGSRDYAVVHEK